MRGVPIAFTRRRLFEKLVKLQDQMQASADPDVRKTYLFSSRNLLSERYGLSFEQVKELEKEGILRGWADAISNNTEDK